jgi:hypothetical protein
MAAGKRGRKKRQPTPDDVAALTGLTQEELCALEEELEKEISIQDGQLERLIPESVQKEMCESEEEDASESLKKYLSDARYHLPLDLVYKLSGLIENLLKARAPDEIKYERWRAVRVALQVQGEHHLRHAAEVYLLLGRNPVIQNRVRRALLERKTQRETYAMASSFLEGTAASASAQMVELDYLAFEQSLPVAERCPIRRKRGRPCRIDRRQDASPNK